MSLRVRVRGNAPGAPRGYRVRPGSFVLSILFHALAIAALVSIPRGNPAPQAPKRPIYEALIQPEAKKIIWYSLPQKLPEVSAEQRIGTFPKPRAALKSPVAIIATAPNPKSEKQFIFQKVPKIQLKQDLPSPNLIARAAMAIPVPPPPEPRKFIPKFDKPKTQGVKSQVINISPPALLGDINKAQQVPSIELPLRKEFVPPPPSQHPPRLPIPVQTAEVPLPNASIAGASPARSALPDGLGAPTFSNGAPPPPPSNAPAGPANVAGKGKVDVAVVGLHPDKGPVPNGERPGQFSQAPAVGEVATGEVKGGIGIPGLTIHDGRNPVLPPAEPQRKVIVYADRLRSLPVSTLSVPLRPASRTIPMRIDALFRNRDVYTMVIPIENIAGYDGDWIIWFAARTQQPGGSPTIHAPIPLRKFESVEPVPPGARTEIRVQIQAVITKQGKLDRILLLRDLTPAIEGAVLRDVQSWEFKPATRDGVPIDSDVVLEIPFSLPPQIAQRSQP
ncbi:MAG TPA: energy transducer TonB [Bryobacteraceae bacterium]|nr:energy transducer TonB [Bryobacteraceae bacterium]